MTAHESVCTQTPPKYLQEYWVTIVSWHLEVAGLQVLFKGIFLGVNVMPNGTQSTVRNPVCISRNMDVVIQTNLAWCEQFHPPTKSSS